MRISHMLLAVLVMAIWALSFIAIDFGLRDTPPLLLCSLRFFTTCFPAIFFIKRPATSWPIIAGYGLFMFALVFSFSFFSIYAGLSVGLAALLMQVQVFFTILLSMIFLKESLTKAQIIGTLVSFLGLFVVGMHVGGSVTLAGFIFIMLSAFSWGIANLISKKAGRVNMLALMVWGSLFAWPLLLIASFIFEGSHKVIYSLHHISLLTGESVIFMAYIATLIGFSAWAWLLSQHKATTVSPFCLLVPIFSMIASMIILHEPLQPWKLLAGILIIGGLSINLLGGRFVKLIGLRPRTGRGA